MGTNWVTSRRTTWVLAVLTFLAVGSYAVSVVPGVRSVPGFDPMLDGWLQGGSYVLLALVALRSLLGDPADRRLRLGIVMAVVLRAAGFVLFLGIVRRGRSPAYPSTADVAWLASSVLLIVGVSYVAWRQSPRATRTLVLDVVVGAFITAGIAVSFLWDTLRALADPGLPPSAMVTNLAYPILDLALLIVGVGVLVAVRGRTSAAVWAMTIGAVGLSVVDSLYYHQLMAGTFEPGSPLVALSLASAALLAWACGWLTTAPRPPARDIRGLAVPALLSTAGLAMLFVGAARGAPLLGLALVTAGIGVAIPRALLTREQDSSVATDAMEEKQLELERFKALVEASIDFVAIGTAEGAVLYLNPRGREMVGLAPDFDVTTTTVADYWEPDVWEEWQQERRRVMIARGAWQGEQRLRHWAGGAPVPVASAAFPIRHPRTNQPWLLAIVQRDISQRLAQQTEVQRLADQRQLLLHHLVEAQEAERARIAADVHDDSVPVMTSVGIQLELLRRRLSSADSELVGSVDQLQESVRGAADRLRHLLFDLDSPAQRNDLRTALEEAAYVLLDSSVRWRFEGHSGADLPDAQRVTAYRVAKEALLNIRVHAQATNVLISVRRDENGVEVEIADDGVGFDVDALERRPGHRGLPDMRDRATIAGGSLQIERRDGGGTRVLLRLPLSVDPV